MQNLKFVRPSKKQKKNHWKEMKVACLWNQDIGYVVLCKILHDSLILTPFARFWLHSIGKPNISFFSCSSSFSSSYYSIFCATHPTMNFPHFHRNRTQYVSFTYVVVLHISSIRLILFLLPFSPFSRTHLLNGWFYFLSQRLQ